MGRVLSDLTEEASFLRLVCQRSEPARMPLLAFVLLVGLMACLGLGSALAQSAPAPVPPLPAALTAAPVPVTQAPGSPGAADLLYRQALYWRAQNDPDRAAVSLRKLLDLQPANADALAELAQIDAEQGRTAEAADLFARLRTAALDDPRIAAVQASLAAGAIDQPTLLRARGLIGQGRIADGVAAYRAAFHGDTPPPTLAVEYYFAYGAVDIIHFERAKRAMAALVADDPQDQALQLAYARLLVNRELTRADGITRLSHLASLPGIGEAARQTWRQALLWQGPDPLAQQELTDYLARYPSDKELDAQSALYKQALPDPSLQMLADAWGFWRNHQTEQAKEAFQKTLALDPRNYQALMMMAVIAKQENRPRDAHDLLAQAIAAQPDKKDDILKTVGGDPTEIEPGTGYTTEDARRDALRAGRAVRAEYYEVSRLSANGQYGHAEALLTPLLRGRTRGNVQLADLQLLNGQTAAAAANFRVALRYHPRDPDALYGLGRALDRQGRADAATPLYAEARAIYAARGNRRAVAGIDQANAQPLAAAAARASDPDEQLRLYRAAVATAPSDPWLRLGLARTLAATGNRAKADSVMAPVQLAGTDAAREASIYYAEGNGDQALAATLIVRLPPRARTGQMRALAAEVALRHRIDAITAAGDKQDQVSQLLALPIHPDPDGNRGVAIGRALIGIGDAAEVRPLLADALAAGHGGTEPQRLSYSGVLLASGATSAADDLTAGIAEPELDRDQRSSLRQVRNGIAIVQSDRLNAAGRPADAYDRLQPRLVSDPRDVGLELALSRLYQSNGKPAQALAINRAVLRQDQQNIDVRMATIDTATASGQLALAGQLAREGIGQAPDDPRIYLKAAQVAQARGNDLEALHDLQTARTLRAQQLDRLSAP